MKRSFSFVFSVAILASLFVLIEAGRTFAQDDAADPSTSGFAQDEAQGFGGRGGGGRGGRGGRGRGGRSASALEEYVQAQTAIEPTNPPVQILSPGQSARSGGTPPAGVPQIPIAFDVWLVTVNLPAHKASDAAAVALAGEIDNLPINLGGRNEVRALIERLKGAEMLQRVREFRVQGVSGEGANIVSGAQVPMITSTTMNSMSGGRGGRGGASGGFGGDASALLGSRVNSLQYQSVGTSIQLVPQVDTSGGINIKFTLTVSEIEKDPDVSLVESADGSGRVAADRIVNQTINASLQLKSGTAALAHSDAESSWAGRAGRPTRLVIVGATTTGAPQQSQPIQSDPPRQPGPFGTGPVR